MHAYHWHSNLPLIYSSHYQVLLRVWKMWSPAYAFLECFWKNGFRQNVCLDFYCHAPSPRQNPFSRHKHLIIPEDRKLLRAYFHDRGKSPAFTLASSYINLDKYQLYFIMQAVCHSWPFFLLTSAWSIKLMNRSLYTRKQWLLPFFFKFTTLEVKGFQDSSSRRKRLTFHAWFDRLSLFKGKGA